MARFYYGGQAVMERDDPGLALQSLATHEPDDSMIECAIAALHRVLRRDNLNMTQDPGTAYVKLLRLVKSR